MQNAVQRIMAAAPANQINDSLLRAILESATDYAIITLDLEGRITTWNTGACTIFGWDRSEVIGQHTRLIFTPEDQAVGVAEMEMRLALATGHAGDERWHVRKDGSEFFALGMLMPLRDNGTVLGYLKILRDRTADRRAAEALQASEARLRLAIDAARMAVWEVDLASDTIKGSPELYRLLGFPTDRPVSVGEIRAGYLPGERERIQAASEAALARGDRHFEAEFRYRQPSGAVLWLFLRGEIYLAPDGAPTKVVGVLLDITERKQAQEALRQSEARHRALVENMPAIVYEARPDRPTELTFVSPQIQTFLGVSAEECTRDPQLWSELIHPDDRDRVVTEVRSAMAGLSPFSIEYRTVARDGRIVWFRDEGQWVQDGTSRTIALQGVMLDITARKTAEEQQQVLMHELTHRVKNTLAMVQAIANQTLRNAPSLQDGRETFGARIAALGQAHDTLMQGHWKSASIMTVLAKAIQVHADRANRFVLDGPEFYLGPKPALALALTVHELSTNAVKYGALSAETGQVEIVWRITQTEDGPFLNLRWQERNGPPVAPPAKKGFGSRLIERGLSGAAGETIQISYDPGGVTCLISTPLSSVTDWDPSLSSA